MKKNLFNTVQVNNPQTNFFDLSHDLKFSMNMGKLIPTTVIDCLPGDKFTIGFENMLRFGALLAPIMHRVKISTHYFFVPNRIVWPNWDKWITGDLEVAPPFTKPQKFPSGTDWLSLKGSIADYMGIPPVNIPVASTQYVPEINALPFAAYWKIVNEFYRDQNNMTGDLTNYIEMLSTLTDGDNSNRLQTPPSTIGTTDWTFAYANFWRDPFSRAWEHDYFTSALPFAQKGDEVYMPIADFNNVDVIFSQANQPSPQNTGGKFRKIDGNVTTPAGVRNISSSVTGTMLQSTESIPLYYDPNGTLSAQTSELAAGSASINNLRRAFRLQEWLEKNARGGTRYAESMMVHFGVRSPDARLQRPEYLGGSVQNMVISEVLSTAQTLEGSDVVNPVGQMAGHGISVGGSRVLNYYCQEHGWIIGLISVMPDTAYQQGIHRKFDRTDRLEYYWPSFANIGEQEIKSKELYLNMAQSESENEGTFGYIPRYAEYKFENNRVAGDFRDQLDFWHLGRKFANRPLLNENFIYPSDPTTFDRIFAVSSTVTDTIYCHVLNKIKAVRKMPKYGTPMF